MITPCNAENGCGTLAPAGALNAGVLYAAPAFAPASGISRSQMTDVTNSRSGQAAQIQNNGSAQMQYDGSAQMQYAGSRAPAEPVQNPSVIPSQTGVIASSFPTPGTALQSEDPPEMIAGQPDQPFLQNLQNRASAAQNQAAQNPAVQDTVLQSQSSQDTLPAIPESNPGSATGIVPPPILPEAPQFAVPLNPLMPPGYQEFISYENLQYLNGFLRTQIGKYMRVEQQVGSSSIEERYGYLIGVGINYILLQELGTGNVSTLDYYNIKFVYIYYTNPSLPQNPQR